jgi:hypothetical protein
MLRTCSHRDVLEPGTGDWYVEVGETCLRAHATPGEARDLPRLAEQEPTLMRIPGPATVTRFGAVIVNAATVLTTPPPTPASHPRPAPTNAARRAPGATVALARRPRPRRAGRLRQAARPGGPLPARRAALGCRGARADGAAPFPAVGARGVPFHRRVPPEARPRATRSPRGPRGAHPRPALHGRPGVR